ncbi:MAG: hypothetical protein PHX54_05365 [Lentimicrobiaceae bacterium]|nr:hypothetical protein [Lentimicrobiaceae bacterium]
MKKILLISLLLIPGLIVFGQVRPKGSTKPPAIMLGFDIEAVKSAYAHWNNDNPDESWELTSFPNRLVYYCDNSGNKDRSNVAHIYDFDEDGINHTYTTVAVQEKIKYACDYLNNIALRNRYLYEYQGVNEENQGVWISNKFMAQYTGCNCGNLKIVVTSNITEEQIIDQMGACPVKPGKSGELLSIAYTTLK